MRLSTRQTRWLLWTLSAMLLGASAALWQLTVSFPVRIDGRSQTRVNNPGAPLQGTAAGKPPTVPALADFEPVLALNLRRPLYDPPPPKPKPKPPPPPLKLRLTGTVIENDDAVAMIADSQGNTVFARVGQTIEEATITKITTDAVEVNYYDETRTLSTDDESR